MLSVVGSEAFCTGIVAPGVEGVKGPVALNSGIAVESSSNSGPYSYSYLEAES